MQPKQSIKKSTYHMILNIALSAFLIIIATVGIYSLNISEQDDNQSFNRSSLSHVMICGIGQCNLA